MANVSDASRPPNAEAVTAVTVDTTAPVLLITDKPSAVQSSPQVTIKFRADPPDDSVKYVCRCGTGGTVLPGAERHVVPLYSSVGTGVCVRHIGVQCGVNTAGLVAGGYDLHTLWYHALGGGSWACSCRLAAHQDVL